MARIINVKGYDAPELDVYVRLTGAQLRNKLEPEKGIFIAESPTVIEVAIKAGCRPISLLTEQRLINGAVEGIIEMCSSLDPDFPVYTASRDVLTRMTGFELTRGALCAMYRPTPKTADELLRDARRVAVLEAVTDSTNIGALIRSAAALNIDAILFSPTCCDPLCRRAIRVSMGTVFQIPFARIGEGEDGWPRGGIELLKSYGFTTLALALRDDTLAIDDPRLRSSERLAMILGTEGTGLDPETISLCDHTVKIPMSHGVDSLNVAAAGAVAFWELGKR
jgi:tRNA G18 (ribose-2'-O)-methylase SpoU